jgi:hypothetical protein
MNYNISKSENEIFSFSWLIKFIPFLVLFFTACSALKMIVYFFQFEISIVEYLSIGEFAALFVLDIVVFAILLLISYMLFLVMVNLEGKSRLVYKIILVILFIAIISFLLLIEKNSQYAMYAMWLFLFGFYTAIFFKKANKLFLCFTFALVIFFSGFSGSLSAKNIINHTSTLEHEFVFKNTSITTTEGLKYLGKFEGYIFLYDVKNKASLIYSTEGLEKIKIIKK